MYSKLLGLGLIAGLASASVFAEPAVQPGETLESLSKAKITTTVNGQPGSLNELIASGKIQPITTAPAQGADSTVTEHTPATQAEPTAEAPLNPANAQAELPDPNAEAQATLSSSADAPVNLETPVQATPNAQATDEALQAAPEQPQVNEDAFAQ